MLSINLGQWRQRNRTNIFFVAEGHHYISKRVCTHVCRGMLVTTQSNLVANYLTFTTTPRQLKNGSLIKGILLGL